MSSKRPLLPLLAAALLALSGCGGDDPAAPRRTPAQLLLPATEVVVADADSVRLEATVLDQAGEPLSVLPAGAAVQWTSSDPAVATVSATGVVVGRRPGVATITARLGELVATTQVRVTPVPSQLVIAAGDQQSATVETAVPDSVAVRVLDRHGEPVSGVTVEFAVVEGGGSVAPTTATTTGAGVARAQWVLGAAVGTQRLRAVAAGDTVFFTSTATEPPSPPPSQTCSPETALALAVGEVVRLEGTLAADLCLGGASGEAAYVAVPFYASEAASAFLQLDLALGNGGATAARAQRSSTQPPFDQAAPLPDAAWEAELRRREIRELVPLFGTAVGEWSAATGAAAVPQVGSLLTLNTSTTCTEPRARVGRVVAVSDRAIVVADTANPAGGFNESLYQEIARTFDTLIYPLEATVFGQPTDIDQNDRVILFYTRAVNELTAAGAPSYVGGYFWAGDLFPKTRCAASNAAEIFYLLAPDPQGELGNVRTAEFVERVTLGTIGHELQHLINAGIRLYESNAGAFEEVWLNEGLSHIAEELLYYASTVFQPRMNLTAQEITATQSSVTAFNRFMLSNMARYRGYLVNPDSVSLMGQDVIPTRGASWAFLRYAADREPGSDTTFFRTLVRGPETGLLNLARVLPDEPKEWMQAWTVSVFADDAVPPAAPAFEQPSWNYRSVIPALTANNQFPLRVQPLTAETAVALRVRAGGAAFVRFVVPAGTVAVLQSRVAELAPPPELRLSVIRVQ